MEQKKKGIFIGGENMEKCAWCFYFIMTVQNSRINVGSRLYLYLYSVVKIGD